MTTQNNNEFLEGDLNSRENFENKWNYRDENTKFLGIMYYNKEGETTFVKSQLEIECKKD